MGHRACKENCIKSEAEEVLDYLHNEKINFAGPTITKNFNTNTKY